MLGFPTAFTLMGMGVIFAFIAYFAQKGGDANIAVKHTLDLMVQRTYGVMTNEVLISIPLFVFMGIIRSLSVNPTSETGVMFYPFGAAGVWLWRLLALRHLRDIR